MMDLVLLGLFIIISTCITSISIVLGIYYILTKTKKRSELEKDKKDTINN